MEKYEFMSRTGEGAYGSVWRARDKNTGVLVAVKKMKDVPATEEEGEIAMREVRVLQLAKHVNIVNLLEAYKSQSGRLYLVFEYVERTLLQELKGNRTGLPPAVVKSITWQMLQALGYLHKKQIIHRDVKPSNVLLTENGVVKLCDFGFARACDNEASDPAYTTYVVTRWYRPPEVLVGDHYGPPVDIWALGCIFAEMLIGRPLFPGKNHHDQLWLILKSLGAMTEHQLDLLEADPQFACFRLPKPSEIESLDQRLGGIVGPAAMQILKACLDPDPKYRASADELLAMPYFHGVTDALPVSDLMAYPDPEMRSKLDRALSQDQANAAAAAAREAVLQLQGGRRLGAPPPSANKPPQPPPQPVTPLSLQPQAFVPFGASASSASASPSPVCMAAQHQQHQQHQQQPQQQLPPHAMAGPPLPAKAATAAKLDLCPVESQQRPPLQRYITAPPGTMAARALGQQPQPQPQPHLQPMSEPYSHHLLPQRSKTGSESSQQSSPRIQLPPQPGGNGNGSTGGTLGVVPAASTLVPVRGRGMSWRLSNDGDGGAAAVPTVNPAVRQLGGPGRQTTHGAPAAGVGGGGGAMAGSGGGGSGGNAGASADASRAVPEQLPAATQRPPYQRATWNGSAAPLRSNGGSGGSNGGAAGGSGSSGGAGSAGGAPGSNGGAISYGGPSQGAFMGPTFLSNPNNPPLAGYDTITMHRKAHSLAGNEVFPLGSGGGSVGNRAVPGLCGLQGRSLAPSLGPGAVPNSHGSFSSNGGPTSCGAAFQLPPSSGLNLPMATGTGGSRMSVSPPPLAYGTFRGNNAMAITGPSLPSGPSGGRLSNDGFGGNGGGGGSSSSMVAAPSCIPAHGFGSYSRPPLQVVGAFGAQAGHGNAEGISIEVEVSESSLAGPASLGQNDGRRASDTVLYAALSLKDSKGRAEKASQVVLGPSRPAVGTQNSDAAPGSGNSSGGGSSSGGGAPGLGALRNVSFGRGGGGGSGGLPVTGTGPSSPDGPLPANLPPLQATPQRRVSAPEAMALAALSGGGGGGGGGVTAASVTVAGGATSRHVPQPQAALHLANGAGANGAGGGMSYAQRHRHPCGQHHNHAALGVGHPGYLPSGQLLHGYGPGQAQPTPVVCGVSGTGLLQQQQHQHHHHHPYRAGTVGDGMDGTEMVNTGTTHVLLPSLDVGYGGKAARSFSSGNATGVAGMGPCHLTARRPSKGTLLRVYRPDAHCKREDTSKILLLEAVPEASVL